MVKNLHPGVAGSTVPSNRDFYLLTNMDGTLYFVANGASTGGGQLWKSDGTEPGTVSIKNDFVFLPLLLSNAIFGFPTNPNLRHVFTNADGALYFSAWDTTANDGFELWKSDGTEAGTHMVKDIRPGPASAMPLMLTDVDGTLYFAVDDGSFNFRELWKSDGTEAGTVLVKDFGPGFSGGTLNYLTNVSGTLFFTANDGVNGQELWKSDGTEAGTVKSGYSAWSLWLWSQQSNQRQWDVVLHGQ